MEEREKKQDNSERTVIERQISRKETLTQLVTDRFEIFARRISNLDAEEVCLFRGEAHTHAQPYAKLAALSVLIRTLT